MRFSVVLFAVFGWSLAQAAVMDPPSLRCASVVNLAGDVELTWVVPPNPNNEFSQYEIYWSSSFGGPYFQVGTELAYGTNTFPHLGVGADAAPQYYYLTTISSTADTSITSDTLATIFLQVTQSTPLGSAVLDWNLQHTPPIATVDNAQGIQMEYPIGIWQQVAAVDSITDHYEHVISICEDSLTFRIAVPNALGCVSLSSVTGDVFSDVTPPTTPVMIGLSVDTATNQTVVDWGPSPEDDTQAYIIVLVTDGGNAIIDTVYGQNNTIYTWPNSDAGANWEGYTIAAYDTCYSGVPPSPNTSPVGPTHKTVHVTASYDKCNSRITVNWTGYVGWPVANYALYGHIDAGLPYLIGTFDGTTFTQVLENVTPFVQYCFVVKAIGVDPGLTSLSNKACVSTAYPGMPQYNYLRNVTVVAENNVFIVDSVDQNATASYYRLERSYNGLPWESIAQQPGSAAPVITFNDVNTLTAERSYKYRVIVADSCGNEMLISNDGNSILLWADADLQGFNRLRWNGYSGWAGLLMGFNIYRSIEDAPFELIGTNAGGDWDYDDDVRPFIASNGKFCYYVEAFEAANPSGTDAVSMSNIDCAVQQEAVWIPNAFIAGGYNYEFKPVIAFVDVSGYELTIFNRWGQEIWTTNNPEEAWKGEVGGFYVPQGMYAYYCSFVNGAGKVFEERGTVTFLWAKD